MNIAICSVGHQCGSCSEKIKCFSEKLQRERKKERMREDRGVRVCVCACVCACARGRLCAHRGRRLVVVVFKLALK